MWLKKIPGIFDFLSLSTSTALFQSVVKIMELSRVKELFMLIVVWTLSRNT